MATPDWITVEVAYARPEQQVVISLQVAPGCTVEQAILASKILERFPEIHLTSSKIGIFGKLTHLTVTLEAGDRVEIYRPLIADPKTARKQRAQRK